MKKVIGLVTFIGKKYLHLNFTAMKKIIGFLIGSVFFLINAAHAQDCPTVMATGPSGNIKEGDTAIFMVNVSGGKTGINPTYNWSISAGNIASGQGTPVIYVNTKGLGGQTITATVEVGGLPSECSRTSSSSASIDAAPGAELHSKGEYITTNIFTDDANRFAGDIMSEYYVSQVPHAVIFLYPGKNATATASVKAMAVSMRSVFAKFGMTSARYKIVTAGKRPQTSYEMWIVRLGAEDPVATPVH